MDSLGRVSIGLVDTAQGESAERVIRASLLLMSPDSWVAEPTFVIHGAKRPFSELARWKEVTWRVRVPGITYLDANEVAGTLDVGVANESFVAGAISVLGAAGIPSGVLRVRVVQLAPPPQILGDGFATIPAGVMVNAEGYGGCSLGFNAVWQSRQVFIVADHCSDYPTYGGSENKTYYQVSRRVGAVAFDPAPRTTGCHVPTQCKNSDAEVVAYDAGMISEGLAARTLFADPFMGSPTLDPARPRYGIRGIRIGLPGLSADHVGINSGWIHGSVTATCVDYYGLIEIQCQTLASGAVRPGDSGGVVFNPGSSGNGYLLGILTNYGPTYNQATGMANDYLFSSVDQIQADVGLLQVRTGTVMYPN